MKFKTKWQVVFIYYIDQQSINNNKEREREREREFLILIVSSLCLSLYLIMSVYMFGLSLVSRFWPA